MTHKIPCQQRVGFCPFIVIFFSRFLSFLSFQYWAGKTTLPQATLSTPNTPGPWCSLEELCSQGKSGMGPLRLLGDTFCNLNVPEGFSIRLRLKKVWSSLRGIARQIQDLLMFKEDADSKQTSRDRTNLINKFATKGRKVIDKTNYEDNNRGREKSRDYGGWEGRSICWEKGAFWIQGHEEPSGGADSPVLHGEP